MYSSTFIFVHDQDIVSNCIAHKVFDVLPQVTYCFLGDRDTSRIKDLNNVVIARDLPYNIEQFPNLTAWSGWYALAANNLIHSEMVNLLEYDTHVLDWQQPTKATGFCAYPETNEMWWNFRGIKPEVLKIVEESYYKQNIPVTSNYSLPKNDVIAFTSFMYNLILSGQLLPQLLYAGHTTERICSWYFQNVHVQEGIIKHERLDSHRTQHKAHLDRV